MLSITPVSALVYASLLVGVLTGLVIQYIARNKESSGKINKYIDNILVYIVYFLIVSIGLLTGVHLREVVIEYTSVLLYVVVLSTLPTLLGFIIAVTVFKIVLSKR